MERDGKATTTTIIKPGTAEAATQGPRLPVVYIPPRTDLPDNLEPGGHRGANLDAGVLTILTPYQATLTVAEQPSLYWYASRTIAHPVEITIVDKDAVEPLLELQLPAPIERGVHRVSLARHGVRLATGVAYRWNVAVVIDPLNRAKDILWSGAMKRVDPPDGLDDQVAKAGGDAAFRVYAQTGFWFDALAALFARIDARPDDTALRRHLAALLTQVDLPEISQEKAATDAPR